MIPKGFLARLPTRCTPSDIAGHLGINLQTVWQAIRSGRLPASKDGQHYIVRRKDVAIWLESGI